ncbi:LysR substrate-binding domain-containing protein [Pendulispora albinea]|uniref:LysR family transcriptional regulator n=1 Tax=Pendulispora albinea TaxID=2741071 RepID=A0ABZ2LVB3_9BACT
MDARLLSGLEVLAAVANAKSFVHASEALGLTQSGVSRAIARLEARVGVRLFDRTPRSVELTEEGRRFYAQVMPLYTGIEEAVNEAGSARKAPRGRLRVNTDSAAVRLLLAPRMGAFLRAQPEVSIELVVRDRLPDLIAEGFDVAVRFGDPEPSSAIARRLLETRILTCAAPAYLARHGKPKHPRELAHGRRECILFRDPTTGRPFSWEFHRGGRILRVPVSGQFTVNDLATGLFMCTEGFGIAQFFELGLDDLLRSGALVELFPNWAEERFPVYVFHPSRHLPSAKVRAFVDFLVASLRAKA